MSNYMSYYLGPYAQVRTGAKTVTYDSCSRPAECQKPTEGFCSKCGREAKFRLSKITAFEPDVRELQIDGRDLENTLISLTGTTDLAAGTATHIFQPNIKGPGRSWDKYDEPEGALEITPEMIESEIRWFRTTFADELEMLDSLAPTSVHWGRVSRWS